MCEWEKNCNDADGRQSEIGVNTFNVIFQSSTDDENERGQNHLSYADFANLCFLKNVVWESYFEVLYSR